MPARSDTSGLVMQVQPELPRAYYAAPFTSAIVDSFEVARRAGRLPHVDGKIVGAEYGRPRTVLGRTENCWVITVLANKPRLDSPFVPGRPITIDGPAMSIHQLDFPMAVPIVIADRGTIDDIMGDFSVMTLGEISGRPIEIYQDGKNLPIGFSKPLARA